MFLTSRTTRAFSNPSVATQGLYNLHFVLFSYLSFAQSVPPATVLSMPRFCAINTRKTTPPRCPYTLFDDGFTRTIKSALDVPLSDSLLFLRTKSTVASPLLSRLLRSVTKKNHHVESTSGSFTFWIIKRLSHTKNSLNFNCNPIVSPP